MMPKDSGMLRNYIALAAAAHTALIESVYLSSVSDWGLKALLSLVLSFTLWLLIIGWFLQFQRRAPLFLSFVILIEMVCLFFTTNYKVPVDANSLAFLAETNFAEAKEFVGPSIALWIIGSISATAAVFLLTRRKLVPLVGVHRRLGRFAAPALFIGLSLLMDVKDTTTKDDAFHYPLVVELPIAAIAYGRQKVIMTYQLLNRGNFVETSFSGGDDDIEAVLIIGESARGVSFSLNGYKRNTTPLLSRLNVISYRDMTSCAAATRISVPCLLTTATMENPLEAASKISLVAGFKARGFSSAWFSSHRVIGENDSLVTALANETDRQYFSQGSYRTRTDKTILAQVNSYIKSRPAKGRLTIIHTIGSHWRYVYRYGPEFARFTPVCMESNASDCTHEGLVNAYDNTILATDDFIFTVLASLQDRNAFVIYTSDHGESLGEDGNFIHGKPNRPEQRNVPLIFWASDQYKQTHPDRYAATIQHQSMPLNHDYIFHSMLDCAGIESNVINKKLSLCSSPEQ